MTAAKENILAAASELFLAGGAAALSVRAIAAKAGVSTIGIYSHFQGKQGILDALYSEGFDRVRDAIVLPDSDGDLAAAVSATTKRYLDLAERHEAHYRLIFSDAVAGYSPSPEAKAAGLAAFERLTDLAAALAPPGARRRDARRIALEFWAIVHGFVSIRHHAIGEWLDMSGWKAVARGAVETHMRALAAA